MNKLKKFKKIIFIKIKKVKKNYKKKFLKLNLRFKDKKYIYKMTEIDQSKKISFNNSKQKNILDQPIPEISVPILKPSLFKYQPLSLKNFAKKVSKAVNKKINNFSDWIISFISKPKIKVANKRVDLLKNQIKDIYKNFSKPIPKKSKTGLKGFLKTYRIDGKNNHDFIIFLDNIKQCYILAQLIIKRNQLNLNLF